MIEAIEQLYRLILDWEENGYFYWQVILKDNITYQIKYNILKHITPKGNKSKIKAYYIEIDGVKRFFNDEVKKMFISFKRPYIISGI